MHKNQLQSIQNLPEKEYESPPFEQKNTEQFKKKAHQIVIQEYLDSIPPLLLGNISNLDQFQECVRQSSLFTYHPIQEIANLICVPNEAKDSPRFI